MKPNVLIPSLCLSIIGALVAQGNPHETLRANQQTPLPHVVARGPHFSVWEFGAQETNASGAAVSSVKRYTQIETGLNRFDGKSWVEAAPKIELAGDYAVGRGGQVQAVFSGEINAKGAVQIITPDGKRLKTKILGLSYFDAATGKSVLIAELKDAQGQLLLNKTQVLYRDCFDGDGVKASVRYTYSKAGVEQDIIFEQQLPSPADWNLDPATTRLEVLTEFFDSASPAREMRSKEEDVDEALSFGSMQMAPGKAFSNGKELDSISVKKAWKTLEGRDFLIERVEYPAVESHLRALPPAPAAQAVPSPVRYKASPTRLLPRQANASGKAGAFKIASASPVAEGFVMDYALLTGQSNCFQGDTTYYVTGPVYATNVVIEGGAVIKYASTNSPSINLFGTITCLAASYRPAVFTSRDDDSVGESIYGSTGNPSNYCAAVALNVNTGTNVAKLQNLRVAYAQTAVAVNGGSGNSLNHLQIFNCVSGINASNAVFSVKNALFYNVLTNFCGNASTASVTHLTADRASVFNAGISLYLTNAILAGVTNIGSVVTNSVRIITNPSGVFQSVGAAGHYLATNSIYRNLGTTNIDQDLLAAIRARTTYPPVVYSNSVVTSNLTLGPIVPRDTNNMVDLGYHYDPLDYAFGGVAANANITFNAGTAVGWFRTSSGWNMRAGHGINMADSQTVSFSGTATSPVYWVRANTVQEGANGIWCGGYGPGGVTGSAATVAAAPTVKARFTRCSMIESPSTGNHFRDDIGRVIIDLANSEFYAGSLGGYWIILNAANCAFERTALGLAEGLPDTSFTLRNCTVRGNSLGVDRSYATPVSIRECAFDGTTMNTQDSFATNYTCTDFDYNAFQQGMSIGVTNGTHNVFVTNFNWQAGPLGSWYQPVGSSLVNAGSRTANSAGLYHFTILTNQVKEATSLVDIGYHYPALNINGSPIDSDGDGIADYLADANGNGIIDAGETPWAIVPTIVSQPTNQSAVQGANATFTVTASGTAPLNYQWLFNGFAIAGATVNSYTVTNVQSGNAGNYSVVVTNAVGTVVSSNATLTVNFPPAITTQPTNLTVVQGSNATFTVSATGTGPLAYQWKFNGATILNATNSTFAKTNVLASDAGYYSVVVTNRYGMVMSSNAYLTVLIPPTITSQPIGQKMPAGSTARFAVTVTGTQPLVYQWYKNGVPLGNSDRIAGTTTNLLQVVDIADADAASYSVLITNLAGQTLSANASLTVDDYVTLGTWHFDQVTNWWRGDGDSTDSVGGCNGTNYGIVSYTNGISNQAFSFNGQPAYMSPGKTAGNFGTNNFKIDFWIKTTNTTTVGVIGKRPVCGADNMWDIRLQGNGKLAMEVCQDTAGTFYAGVEVPVPVNDGSFHHIVISRQTMSINAYVDDALTVSVPMPGLINFQNNTELEIGKSACTGCDGTGYFNGLLDEIMLTCDNPFVGEKGQQPIARTNATTTTGIAGRALSMDTNVTAQLCYSDLEANGFPNITCKTGSISFWFKPDWSSLSTNGMGPQSAGRFVEVGTGGATNGWWTLLLNTNGTQISFVTQSNTVAMTNLTVPINWTSNQWHQVQLSYSATKSSLFIDGSAVKTNGLGVSVWPSAAVRAQGFRLGTDSTGIQQVRGAIDEFRTYNYSLNP